MRGMDMQNFLHGLCPRLIFVHLCDCTYLRIRLHFLLYFGRGLKARHKLPSLYNRQAFEVLLRILEQGALARKSIPFQLSNDPH